MPEAHLEMSHLFWSSYKPYFTDQRSPTSSRHSRFAVLFQMLAFMDMLGTQSSLKTNIAVNFLLIIDITKFSSILFRFSWTIMYFSRYTYGWGCLPVVGIYWRYNSRCSVCITFTVEVVVFSSWWSWYFSLGKTWIIIRLLIVSLRITQVLCL